MKAEMTAIVEFSISVAGGGPIDRKDTHTHCVFSMLQLHAELSFPLSMKVLFDSWWSSSHHLWHHSCRQCQQLWRQQPLVSTTLLFIP